MSVLDDILVPIAALGGLGAAIDFFIGNSGQKRIKSWLEDRWYRFHELNWHNFSEKEARFYVDFFDRFFGPYLFSSRRFIVCVSLTGFTTLIFSGAAFFAGYSIVLFGVLRDIVVDSAILAISFSLTRWTSLLVIRTSESRLGFLPFLVLLTFHYLMLALWRPIADVLFIYPKLLLIWFEGAAELIRSGAPDSGGKPLHFPFEFLLPEPFVLSPWSVAKQIGSQLDIHYWLARLPTGRIAYSDSVFAEMYVGVATQILVSAFANAIRVVFALALLLSFLGRRWIGPIFSTVWARLVETEKPVFTIVFGAGGAFATAIKELMKLW
jgi:hypothetical protein